MDEPWMMRVEGALAAHFARPEGGSRPGVQWAIGLKQGERIHRALVTAFFADGATDATRADQQYQAQTVMQYLNDRLNAGWNPGQALDHVIFIGNPLPGPG